MESAETIEWVGNSQERLIQRALDLEAWGEYQGISNLGRRLLSEVDQKIKEISQNLNLYAEREFGERVAPLQDSKHILVYKKQAVDTNIKLLLVDIRRFY